MIPTFPINTTWNSLIEERMKNVFYYDQRWLDLITKLYGYRVIPLTTTNADGQIIGYLPLCSINSILTGRRLVALPFSDSCPLLAVDEESANDLVNQAIRLAREQNVKYLELRTGVNDVLAKRPEFTETNLYVNWSLPLSNRFEDVWSGLRKPVQHQIKKSQKLGVQVRVAQKREEMNIYYRLHLQTRSKKHGMPTQSQNYFYTLWDTFALSGTMQLLLAEYQEMPIAGILLFTAGNTIHYSYGASDERYLNMSPNNLLFWKAIMWGCEQGYKHFDLGRTACDNEGLMEFKRRWGAVKEAMPYYYYPETDGLASTSESSKKYQLLTNTWKKLPLSITGPLGAFLYKHLG